MTKAIAEIERYKKIEENLRNALKESRQREAEIYALLKGAKTILKYRDFQTAARAIFDTCKDLIGATAGYVALLSEDGAENKVLFLDSGGLPCTVDPSLPMPIRGLRAEAYHEIKAVYDNDFKNSKWQKYMPLGHVELDNVLFAPLVLDGKAVGLLGIANKPGGFDENDGRMAAAFANLAAIALYNSLTLESLNKHRSHLEELVKERTEELMKANEKLMQSQKMEAVGHLAGGIAHDFNNILTAIMGYGALMQAETGENRSLKHYAEQILSSAERAANLIQGLLAFSRKQIIALKPVNLNDIVRRIEKLLGRLIGEDIEMRTTLKDKDMIIMADSGQIEQVLMNLCTNARDAMPGGGLLSIETGEADIDEEYAKRELFAKTGRHAVLSVTDTGIGMDEKTKQKIFEPFFTTKEVGKGTGLGLSIIYGIIKQHDGHIHVYSEKGRGTTFKIYLPIIESAVAETQKKKVMPAPKGGTETVLVAEDNTEVRNFLKDVLERFGYFVIEAADGEEAIKMFHEHRDRIKLLILDTIIPKKSGREVYEEIAKVKPDIKILFMSGYAADVLDKKGVLGAGTDFIPKPILPADLLRKVREVLDK